MCVRWEQYWGWQESPAKGFIWLAFTVSQKLSGRLCVGVNGSRARACGLLAAWDLWEQRTKPDFLAVPLPLSPVPTLLLLSPAPQLPTDPLVLTRPHPTPQVSLALQPLAGSSS